MKKLIIIFAVVMIGVIIACGEKKAEESYLKISNLEPELLPEWYYDGEISVKQEPGDSVKFIYFKISKEMPVSENSARIAGRMANTYIRTIVADFMYNLVATEIVDNPEYLSPEYGKLISNIPRSFDFHKLIPAGRIYRNIEKTNSTGEIINMHEATLRQYMVFDVFVDYFMYSLEKKLPSINEKLKEDNKLPVDKNKIREKLVQMFH
jgi:hypothetical protein